MALGAAIAFIVVAETGSHWTAMLAGGLAGIACRQCLPSSCYWRLATRSPPASPWASWDWPGRAGREVLRRHDRRAHAAPPDPVSFRHPDSRRRAFQPFSPCLPAPLMAVGLWWALKSSKVGLIVRAVGKSPELAHAVGYNVVLIRFLAVVTGGFMAGSGRRVHLRRLDHALVGRADRRARLDRGRACGLRIVAGRAIGHWRLSVRRHDDRRIARPERRLLGSVPASDQRPLHRHDHCDLGSLEGRSQSTSERACVARPRLQRCAISKAIKPRRRRLSMRSTTLKWVLGAVAALSTAIAQAEPITIGFIYPDAGGRRRLGKAARPRPRGGGEGLWRPRRDARRREHSRKGRTLRAS